MLLLPMTLETHQQG